MGFAPSPKDIIAESVYASWHELGKQAVPYWGGARDTWYTNQSRGYEILRRIDAVGGGVDNGDELRQKELEQSPAYIAEQKRIADEKIRFEEQRLLDIELENQRIAELKQKLADEEEEKRIQKEAERVKMLEIEEQNELVELRRLEHERIQAQNLLEAEKQIEVDMQAKNKIIATVLLIGGVAGMIALSKRKII